MFFGYLPDGPDHGFTCWSNSPIARATVWATGKASMREFSPEVFDQGKIGSCGGHGTTTSLVQVARANGLDLGVAIPSPLGIYQAARRVGRARVLQPGQEIWPMTDSGAMPRDIRDGITQIGIREMGALVDGRFSDCSAENVNQEPDIFDFVAEGEHRLIGHYRVGLGGSALVDALQLSLVSRGSVCVGIFADSAFSNWSSTDAPLDGAANLQDPNGGWHWIDIEEIETTANGSRIVTFLNSWGADRGDQGRFRVTERWFTSTASDPTVFAASIRRAA